MSSRSKNTSLNAKYLEYLAKYPLLTKSITAGVLAILNETIATTISKDFKVSKILNQKIKHPFSLKIPLLALFAFSVNTPISHYGFILLNKLFKNPLSKRDKILQILTMLITIVPFQSSLIVAFISIINMKPSIQSLTIDEFKRCIKQVKLSMQNSLFNVLKSSWITTPIVLTISQNYLHPNLWTLFSNLVFFFLGTGQNTFLKIQAKKAREYNAKREEIEKEVKKEVEKKDEKNDELRKDEDQLKQDENGRLDTEVADALEDLKTEKE
ncbi:putative membrane protein [Wickerhamomyces ciferrii]|uniref:Membrane protein n=1 Tax=Wickerhamomyces ciferrii (strain ATCC 14091 / BCRC 22168 / CBS 111 / JCM 3599 / NBRC 0793 / NRRL Y-1031 F-60-10) TaxID=1206466 RepID=K0KQM2_WICCF|nr:uncharacterized protein BN7_4011 [Wickerhamomyces ciferrii]CCH44447.1 putative membrane protein [Wickerhamomyces ciferrii]